jgi:CheY-like chemotaxis protein/anti-sigma regulatory factor (Ser/Thr protein kinase)
MPKILIVDDSAFDRQRAAKILARQSTGGEGDLVVVFAADGKAALEVIAEEQPDVVVTDLQMPNMDGLELVREVRSKHQGLPVIIMTAAGSEDTALEAIRRGAASYVPKNAMAADLLETVEGVLETVQQTRDQQRIRQCLKQTETQFVLTNDASLIPPLVGYLKDSLLRFTGADNGDALRVTVALREALLNAMHHGNLGMSSQLRESDESKYHAMVEERRLQEPYKDRHVYLTVTESSRETVYTIRDEGAGFDPSSLPDPTDPANLEKVSGRGLLLIRSFMTEVRHNETGNVITMVWRDPR